ncbi:MAG: MarR family winged helix-turn-helix transcriptional regulator [Lachnospiraceae bacterium]|nr:MarR family winged helix-turn-helix transcriptional regulator [Lachnospiraceae bacterium]
MNAFKGMPRQAGKIMNLMMRMKKIQFCEICPELNPTEVMVLLHLCPPDRDWHWMPLCDLTAHLNMLPASMSRVMKSMEDQGLIFRTIDPNSRRNIIVEATDQGVELAKICRKRFRDYWEDVARRIPEEDWDSLLRILTECTDSMETVLKEYTENSD